MELSLSAWIFAILVTLLGGFVKGVVGFAMPLIMISGLSLIMPPSLALAGLIIPTLVSNIMQSFRFGPKAAWSTMVSFRVFLITGLIVLVFAAGLVSVLPDRAMMLFLGIPITLFALSSLFGKGLVLPPNPPAWVDAVIGAVAGFFGGLSGVWGPPVVVWLTARQTPKLEAIRVQGVIFLLGAITLLFAHIASGVLNSQTIWLSVALVLPAFIGMYGGQLLSDRIDQATFRKATLIVLMIAGLNLLRRAVFA